MGGAPSTATGRTLEIAYRRTLGPPSGPTWVSIPEDILTQPTGDAPKPVHSRHRLGVGDVNEVAQRLATSRFPLVIVGGQVRRLQGVAHLENLAELLALPVAPEPFGTIVQNHAGPPVIRRAGDRAVLASDRG